MPNPEQPAGREAMALMQREMRVAFGPVGNVIDGTALRTGAWLLRGEEFLMHLETMSLRYRKGKGVTAELREGTRQSELDLFLNGSVYAAAACLNGLFPIHASAVAHEGRVHAFTGPSGAGKSTLVTALGNRGLPMFCDDTLILDLSDPEVPLALPGHKRLKLTAEALALTGVSGGEQVHDEVPKFYADPPAGDCADPLPLHQLVFLDNADCVLAEPITGAEKIARLSDDHYLAEIWEFANQPDPAMRFALHARLARQVRMARLGRPRNLALFDQTVTLAQHLVCGHETGS
ncbi:MAG: hypothetical protein ACKOPO_05570 [Novosphingobium sp.]